MVFPLSLFLMKPHITQKLLDDSSQKKKAYFPNFPHKYMDKFTIVKHPQKYITLCVYIYIYSKKCNHTNKFSICSSKALGIDSVQETNTCMYINLNIRIHTNRHWILSTLDGKLLNKCNINILTAHFFPFFSIQHLYFTYCKMSLVEQILYIRSYNEPYFTVMVRINTKLIAENVNIGYANLIP